MKASIVFYSATGNTQMMADHIMNDLSDRGYEVTYDFVSDANAQEVSDSDLIVLGSPAMGVEEIEEYEFRPFYDDLKSYLDGKKVILFGSFDWGDQEWMSLWKEETESVGAEVIATITANLTPTPDDLETLTELLTSILQ